MEGVGGGLKVGYPTREMAEKVGPSSLSRTPLPFRSVRSTGRGRGRACVELTGFPFKVLAMGTRDIPQIAGTISATWYTPPSESNGGAGQEVEMVEDDARRGDHDEDD